MFGSKVRSVYTITYSSFFWNFRSLGGTSIANYNLVIGVASSNSFLNNSGVCTNPSALYYQDPEGHIIYNSLSGNGPDLRFETSSTISNTTVMPGTSIRCDFTPLLYPPAGQLNTDLRIFYQVNGSDIVEAAHNLTTNVWSYDTVPVA